MAVSQNRPTYENRYLDNPTDGKLSRQTYFSMEQHKNLEQRLHSLDDKLRNKMVELEGGKQELVTIKSESKSLEKKMMEMDVERKSLETKLNSLEVKLAVSNQNVNVSKDALEKLRTKMNDAQITVARLEERQAAMASELERLRDPANPDSNNSIKKHVVNDKKDIKRLKYEIDIENEFLQKEHDVVIEKDVLITKLEADLESAIEQLACCEESRREARENEEEEIIRKTELLEEYKHLRSERKQYVETLKNYQVKLGVTVAGEKVNAKLASDVKRDELKLSRRLTFLEKKCKEAGYELDILRSRDNVTKTALSINDHKYRFKNGKEQFARGGSIDMRKLQDKLQGKTTRKPSSMPERLKLQLGQKPSRQSGSTQSQTDRRKVGSGDRPGRPLLSDRTPRGGQQKQQQKYSRDGQQQQHQQQQQQQQQKSPRAQKPDRSIQFIPHPKPKIK